jgi:Tfp pilus assembly protein PilP
MGIGPMGKGERVMKTTGLTRKLIVVLAVVIAGALLLPGCERPSAPPPVSKTTRQKQKAAERQLLKKTATPKRKPMFSYDPRGLVDPFKPFIEIGDAKKNLAGRPKGPLQEYDLSQLTLTAIIMLGNGDSRAMVRDSAGKGFTVRKGTYVGNRGGRVKAIHLDRVIIEEPVRLYGDEMNVREIVMKMPAEGGKR